MRSLLPFLALFKHAKLPLFFGLMLMITGLAASIGLLTLSGWFLAASAIAGTGALFNFFYPSAGVRGLAIGRTAARYFEKYVTHDATFRLLAKLRVRVFAKIIPLSPAVLNRYRNSDLLNRLVADVDTLDSLYLRLIAPFISSLVVILFITVGLSFIHLPIALFVGVTLTALLCVIPTVFYRLGTKFGADLTRSRSRYREQVVEFIQAQAELLLFNAQDSVKRKLNNTEHRWQDLQRKEAGLSALSAAFMLFFNGVTVVVVLWAAADANLAEGPYKAALIGLLTFTALASFEILMPLGAAFLHIGQVIASAQRVNEIIEQPPLVRFDGTELIKNAANSSIEVRNLTFRYPDRSEIALNRLNLSVKSGRKSAILGKTGSGKSTLLQLLVRNYDAQQGQILLADRPISCYTEQSLREQIAFLTQRVHIFSDTLRNNLQLANKEKINDETMQKVLRQVGLAKLGGQEQGLDLWLGDGGRPLSGGERRRLGLARILLSNAPVLLLDEPTEGLDRETERDILHLILRHAEGKTLIMVTHRLTLLERFDHIYVIDDANLIEQGSYRQLAGKENGYFKRLLERI